MYKIRRKGLVVFLIMVLLINSQMAFATRANYKETEHEIIRDVLITDDMKKIWRVRFSGEVDEETIDDNSIAIENNDGERVNIEVILEDEDVIKVVPSDEYKEGVTYKLRISSDVTSKRRSHLSKNIIQPFIYYPNGKPEIQMVTENLIIKSGDDSPKNVHIEVCNIGDREAIVELKSEQGKVIKFIETKDQEADIEYEPTKVGVDQNLILTAKLVGLKDGDQKIEYDSISRKLQFLVVDDETPVASFSPEKESFVVKDHSIENIERKNNKLKVEVDESSAILEEADEGEIVFVEASASNPLGYVGVVKDKTKKADGGYEIEMEEATLEEAFNEIAIDTEKNLSFDDIILSDLPAGVKCTSRGNSNLSPGWNIDQIKAKSELKKEVNFEKQTIDGLLFLEIDDAIIYDADGDAIGTQNDQIKLNGTMGFKNMKAEIKADYDKIYDWRELRAVFDTDQVIELNVEGNYEAEFDMAKEFNRNRENDNKLEVEFGPVAAKMEGIDFGDRIILGSVVFDMGKMVVIPSNGEPTKVDLAVVVMFTANFRGEIEAHANLGFSYDAYIKKGIDIHKTDISDIDKGDKSVDVGDYTVEVYNRYSKTRESKESPEPKFTASIDGRIETEITAGPEVAVMLAGVMPAAVKMHVRNTNELKLNGNLELEGSKLTTSGKCAGSSELDLDLGVEFALKGEVDVDTWFVKHNSKFGEYYSDDMSVLIWKKEFESSFENEEDLNGENYTAEEAFTTREVEGGLSITDYDESYGVDVNIPDKIGGKDVVEIGALAFGSKGLETVKIPISVTKIGEYAFNENNLKEVEIPSSVMKLGDAAFYENKLESLILPEDLKEIGLGVFCENKLETVKIPSSIVKIGEAAFKDNELVSLKLPEDLKEIGHEAFKKNNIEEVEIPSSVTKIGDNAFDEYVKIHKMDSSNEGERNDYTAEEAFTTREVEGGVSITDYDESYGLDVNIPDKIGGKDVVEIDCCAFQYTGLYSVQIPSSVKNIGYEAFSNNEIENLNLKEGLEKIEMSAFACNKLENLSLPKSLKLIERQVFMENQISSLEIPSGVQKIGRNAFVGNKLKKVELSEGLKEISAWAFGDNEIEEIKLPKTVELIGHSAFSNNQIKKVELSEGLKEIGSFAFSENQIKKIKIPNSVVTVGVGSFEHNKLESVEIASTTKYYDNSFLGSFGENAEVNVTKIDKSIENREMDENAFVFRELEDGIVITDYHIEYGFNVKIPNKIHGKDVVKIEADAFRDNFLEKIEIPDSVVSIEDDAFSRNRLKSVILPKKLEYIGEYAFFANELEEIKIPDEVKTIGECSFYSNKIKNIELPDNLEEIGLEAFLFNNLNQVSIPSKTNCADDAFDEDVEIHRVNP